MKNFLTFMLLYLVTSVALAEDKPVDAAGIAAMGKVINSVAENSCAPTKAVYKGAVAGRVYILTYCQSGASYAVHFLPDGTDTRVTDCAALASAGSSCNELTTD